MASTLRKITMAVLAPAMAIGATVGLASAPASAAVWSSCAQYGNTSLNGYTLYNNIWGSGAGAQCIWANSGTNWGVNANHPNTGGIKSYPNSKKVINKSITSLGSLSSNYNVTVPSSGAYNTSYDIWDTDYKYEIMLWVNKTGAVGPLGTSQGNVDARRPHLDRLQGQQRIQRGVLVRPHLQLHLRLGQHPADPEVDQGHQGLVRQRDHRRRPVRLRDHQLVRRTGLRRQQPDRQQQLT